MNSREFTYLLGGMTIGAVISHVLSNKQVSVSKDDIDIDNTVRKVREVINSKEAHDVAKSTKDLWQNMNHFSKVYNEFFGEDSRRSDVNEQPKAKSVYGPVHLKAPGPYEPQGPGPKEFKGGKNSDSKSNK